MRLLSPPTAQGSTPDVVRCALSTAASHSGAER